MSQSKTTMTAFIALVIGFTGGFALRPVIAPQPQAAAAGVAASTGSNEARGTQYFAANLEEARRIVAGCREGSVRGEECANAQRAVTETEGRDRFKKFMGH